MLLRTLGTPIGGMNLHQMLLYDRVRATKSIHLHSACIQYTDNHTQGTSLDVYFVMRAVKYCYMLWLKVLQYIIPYLHVLPEAVITPHVLMATTETV